MEQGLPVTYKQPIGVCGKLGVVLDPQYKIYINLQI